MKKKLAAAAAACTLAGAMAIGSTFAYLTDRQSATNTFTVGSVKIELKEPGFNKESAENIVPNQVIQKDPTINNTGENPALVFAKVVIPKQAVYTEEQAASGDSSAATTRELFTFLDGDGNELWTDADSNGNWLLLEKDTTGKDSDTYLFGYSTEVAKGETTDTIFDKVRYLNVVEGQVKGSLAIPVEAYAIQADNIQEVTISENMSKETLKKVFDTYLKSRRTFTTAAATTTPASDGSSASGT